MHAHIHIYFYILFVGLFSYDRNATNLGKVGTQHNLSLIAVVRYIHRLQKIKKTIHVC
jgi:hypothetical protein